MQGTTAHSAGRSGVSTVQLQIHGCPESLHHPDGKTTDAPLWPVPLPILGPVSKATLIHVFAVAEAQPDHK